MTAMRMRIPALLALLGAAAAAQARYTRTDYMIGSRSQWHTGIRSYSRVRYDGVYPGIDVVYYGNQSQLEYDFVLAPGADPSAIRIEFCGADRLRLNADGDLVVEAAGSEMVQRRPMVYQHDSSAAGRHEVATHYALLGRNIVGFQVEGYDHASELVIDPVLAYCTYLGGSGKDQVNAVKYLNGKLYMAGQTDTSDQPPANGAWANNLQGLTNITVSYFSPAVAGRKLWGPILKPGAVWLPGDAAAPTLAPIRPSRILSAMPLPPWEIHAPANRPGPPARTARRKLRQAPNKSGSRSRLPSGCRILFVPLAANAKVHLLRRLVRL